MSAWIWVSLVLAVMVIALFFQMNKKSSDVAAAQKQADREWTLKVALEKTFKLPEVPAEELANIEARLEQIELGPDAAEEKEEKIRAAVMALYADKYERLGMNKQAPRENVMPPPFPPISGRK